MRSVSSALLLAKRLRAAALVGDRYAVRFLGAAACEAAAAFGSLPVLLATWIFAPPQAGEKDERRFEKRNLCSRVPRLRVHVAVFWSHAKSRAVLGGTLGENAAWCSGHGSSAQEDGCGLSPAAGPARHVVLCGHRSVFSSPPGRQNASPPRIFSTNPHCRDEKVTRSPSQITTTQPQKVPSPVRRVLPSPGKESTHIALPALWKREGVFVIPLLVIRD